MVKNEKHSISRNSVYEKNTMRLKLLISLPSFQTDVKKIRKELDIPEEGLGDIEYKNWHEENIIEKNDKIRASDEYINLIKKANKLRWKNHSEYLKTSWLLNDLIPINKFQNRLIMLGEKYNLPKNFYSYNPHSGIWLYITLNKICAPSNNWSITPNPEGGLGTATSMSLTTYAPLDKKELKNGMNMLKDMQKTWFPNQVVFPQRIKNNFERDLEIYKELCIQRRSKPIKRKTYVDGGYLSRVKNKTKKQMLDLERKNKSSVYIDFDEVTSSEVAKKFKITNGAVRGAIKRMRALIKNLFDIEDVR